MINEQINTVILMYHEKDLSNAKVTETVNEISMDENSEISFSLLVVINYVNCRMPSGQVFQLFMNGTDDKTGKFISRMLVNFEMPPVLTKQRVSQVKTIYMDDITIDIPNKGDYSFELFMCDPLDMPDDAGDNYDIRKIGKIVSSYFFGVV